ncbi:MAG: c-type cytochrome [Pseudomonadota bacterium]
MQKKLNTKITRLVSYALLSGAVVLSSGCSNDAEDAKDAEKAKLAEMGITTQQNAMDVKQPEVVEAPKESLQPAPVVEEKVETPKEEPKEEPKEAVPEVIAAPSGAQAYATCIGCHGANAEGGVGPRLNNQNPEDIVDKLERYKAGEQVGPMTGMMAPMAASLTTDEMQAIADYVVTLN